MDLQRTININKKFIVIMILLSLISVMSYYSYALFQVNVVKNGVIIIRTGSIDLTATVQNETNNTFTVTANSSKTVTINLTSTNSSEIAYKMYYENLTGELTVTSNETFTDNIVEGKMTTSKTITLTFTNSGSDDVSITLGGLGGLAQYPIPIEDRFKHELIIGTISTPGSEFVLKGAVNKSNNVSACQNKTYIEEDGITYISGTKGCINFNYVWWSGYMWRITAIYPDGSMKMVTDNNITSIAFNNNETYYDKTNGTKSYMFQWLNEDFLDTLYNQGADVIDTTKYWNATMITSFTTKPAETEETMIPTTISPVGLLNSYEHYKSYQNVSPNNGYLNISYNWWLLNVWYVGDNGSGYNSTFGPTYMNGARPSVYLKSGISLSGSGTKESPYRLSDDYDEADMDDKVYTRHSGEYIKFDTDGNAGNYDNAPLFRIVGVEGEGNARTTKVVAMNYAANKASKKFASSVTYGANGNTQSNDYWDYYLNNDWYDSLSFKEKLTSGNYYLGLGTSGYNYKKSICSTDTTDKVSSCIKQTSYPFMVGLLRYGEMFATQQGAGYNNSISMWLITKRSPTNVWYSNGNGNGYYDSPTNTYGSRPTYYLKSEIRILSGSGTELDPYIVS